MTTRDAADLIRRSWRWPGRSGWFSRPRPAAPRHLSRRRAALAAVDLVTWRRHGLHMLSVVAAACGVIALSAGYLRDVSLYLTPDAAHYLADADALTGSGVRELRHAPLFPLIVAGARMVSAQPVTAFHLALGLTLAGLVGSLYVLLRRWVSPGPALFGSVLGTCLPTTAELMGWQGGATLAGVAALALALAAVEAWVTGHPRGGPLTGAALGLAALAHPFLLAVAAWCVAVRWTVHALCHRRPSMGWGPLGLRGVGSSATVFLSGLAVVVPVYRRLQGGGGFALQFPQPEGVAALLGWATGGWLVVALLVVAAAAAFVFSSPGPVAAVSAVGLLTLFMASAVDGSSDYVSRIAYVLPVPVAAGLAAAAQVGLNPGRSLLRRLPRPRATAGLLLVALVGGLAVNGYGPRLERAASYYQWLQPDDIPALQRLGRRTGTVATSWKANDYGSGVATSWYVEGLARRPAFGPTEPQRSMIPEQVEKGADMQRLFAGDVGVENGVLQVAAGPRGARTDPALAVRSAGFYQPLLFVDSLVDDYPVPLADSTQRTVRDDGVEIVHREDGEPVLRQDVRLDGRRMELSYELADSFDGGEWEAYLWPAYGYPWRDATVLGEDTVAAQVDLPEETVGLTVTAPGAEVTPVSRDDRFGLPTIRVRASELDELSIIVDVTAQARPSALKRFHQGAILDRHDVTDVLVMKDTGWRERFDQDGCYRLNEETSDLLLYRVTDPCAGGAPVR